VTVPVMRVAVALDVIPREPWLPRNPALFLLAGGTAGFVASLRMTSKTHGGAPRPEHPNT
jgi:hypothetical protein